MKKLLSCAMALFASVLYGAFAALTNHMQRHGLILSAAYFPNGTIFSLATAYEAPLTLSAISNADPGVATSAAHGLSDGDIIVVSSGWTGLNDRTIRVADPATGTFSLEGVNTTSTSRFPAGAGEGTAKKVQTWVSLSQVTDSASSGGEQQFAQWVYLDDGRQRQRPTFKNAKSLQLTLDYDPALAWYDALINADLDGDPVAVRAALPNGAYLYYNMYVGFDGEPSMTINQNMSVVASFSHAAQFIRYAS